MTTRKHFTRRLSGIALGTAAVILSGWALAGDVQVKLGGDQEVPPVTTSATGSGTITINDDKSVSGSVTTSGVDGVAAHIHNGAPGKNGPVIVPMSKTADNTFLLAIEAPPNAPRGVRFTALCLDCIVSGSPPPAT